jgi:triosephosphate isomerase
MLDSVGVKWALAGHSERRVIFGETDEYINGQCKKLIDQGMAVMLCIGESEAEYEQDLAGAVCAVQLKKGLAGISKKDLDRVAIACKSLVGCMREWLLVRPDEWIRYFARNIQDLT